MTKRRGEFPHATRYEALQFAEWRCERCGRKKGQRLSKKEVVELSVHHILPIHIAARYFPFISSEMLRNIHNAEVLCQNCHKADHDDELPLEDYKVIASELAQRVHIERNRVNV